MQEILAGLEAPEQGATPGASAGELGREGPAYVAGRVAVGRNRRQVHVDGRPIAVTPIEYRLLRCLCETPGEAVSFRRLVAQTHAYDAAEAEAATMLKSHLRNLRRKLPPGCLTTLRGSGLVLSASGAPPAEERLLAVEAAA